MALTFELPPEADTYRAGIRAFLEEHAPGGKYPADWTQRLAKAGYVAPHWPKPWGRDASPIEQLVIDEELKCGRRTEADEPDRHRLGRADAARRRDRGAAGEVPARRPRRLRDLVPAVQRAGGGQRPRVAAYVARCATATSTCSTARRSGRRSASSPATASSSPAPTPTPRRTRASRTSCSTCRRRASTSGRSSRWTSRRRSTRCSSTTSACPHRRSSATEHDGWRLAKVTLGNERVSLSGEGALWGLGPTAHDLLDLVRDAGGVADPVAAPAAGRALHRVRGAAADPAAHRVGQGAGARARARGVGAQGARRRARPARDGRGRRPRGDRRVAARPGPVRRADRHVGEGLPLLPRPHHRRRHQRGAAQHPRRAHPRPPPRRPDRSSFRGAKPSSWRRNRAPKPAIVRWAWWLR